MKQVLKNANLKNIKKSLSHAPKKWTFLEDEFDQIIHQIKKAQQDLINMTKMSQSTLNMIDLFEFHQIESEKI